MARVNVEQKALTDARFKKLGMLAGAPMAIATASGIGLMLYVWNHCQELETRTLDPEEIDLAMGISNASHFVTESGLGVAVKGGKIRIKGTKGRIEWLAKSRKTGRKGGKKGGRPRKTPTGYEPETPMGLSQKTPPAPAPALDTKKKKNPSDSQKKTAEDLIESFELTDEIRSYAAEHYPLVKDLDFETRRWRDHFRANGYRTKSGPVKDAAATWRTWLSNAQKWAAERTGGVTPALPRSQQREMPAEYQRAIEEQKRRSGR